MTKLETERPHLATKYDLEAGLSDVKDRISSVNREVNAAIAALRWELEIAALRREMKAEIAALRREMAEFRTEIKDLRRQMDLLLWMLPLLMVLMTGVIKLT